MKIGFAVFQSMEQTNKKRFCIAGREVHEARDRSAQSFTHYSQPIGFDHSDPFGWRISHCREINFDAIKADLNNCLSRGQIERIGNLLAKRGFGLAPDYGDDFAAPKRMVQGLRSYARVAKALGISGFGIGRILFSTSRFIDGPSLHPQMKMIGFALRPVVSVAEEEGRRLAIENHTGYWCVELIEFVIHPMGSTSLGIRFDTGNCPTVIEDPAAAARASAPLYWATQIKKMHVNLVIPGGEKIDGAPIGRGIYQPDRVDRTLSIEIG